jgi:UPF0176 protein
MKYQISAFYKFIALAPETHKELKKKIEDKAESLNIHGLFLMGTEGINATVAGLEHGVLEFKDFMTNEFGTLAFKDSYCDFIPFRAFKLKIKPEIVTIGDTSVVPQSSHWNHITPQEWEHILKNDKDAVVIDTRNWYETQIGKFKKAIDLNLNEFNEFPEKIKNLDIPKDKKVLIYCTGGIRCEKAILEMQKQGFNNVYQLEGGILKYFEDVKSDEWEGECFVFDRRVAVDTDLQPSQTYTFCPHCGQPASVEINCIRCGKSARVCMKCLNSSKEEYKTCSKNCAHHHAKGNRLKRKHQGLTRQELHRRYSKLEKTALQK